MATIITRAGKGSPLTNNEVDANFTNLNADKIENVVEDTTPQLGGNLDTNGNDITFGDNDRAIFGAGSDLEIYHDSSHSYIWDKGTGSLRLRGANLNLENPTGGNYLSGADGGEVSLWYGNTSKKLATTSTGIDVTGTVTADGLTVEGSTAPTINIKSTDATVIADDVVGAITFEESDATGGTGVQAFIKAIANDSGSTYDMSFGVGGNTEAIRIDQSGNVGIGTSSPATALHISSASAPELRVEDTTNNTIAALRPLDTTVRFGAFSNVPLEFYTNSTERMRIDSAGILMVGTTDTFPGNGDTNTGFAVQATGNAAFSTDDNRSLFNRNNSDGDILAFHKDGSTVGSIGTRAGRLKIGDGNVGLFFDDTNNRINPEGPDDTNSNDEVIDIGTGSHRFKDLYLSGKITNDGTGGINIDTSGNVGIGTTSPQSRLHVYTGASGQTPNSETKLAVENSSTAAISILAPAANESIIYFGSPTSNIDGSVVYNHPNRNLSFRTGGNSERMRIDSSGNVGIGTTSPENVSAVPDLTVAGKFFTSDGTPANPAQSFTSDQNTGMFRAGADTLAFTTGGSEAARIDSSGNLLVGKSTTDFNTEGHKIGPSGEAANFVRNGNIPLLVNRLTNDGEIVRFAKDGSTVGSIGTRGSQLYVGTGDTALKFLPSSDAVVGATTVDGTGRDGAIDLGLGGSRFKDLYLSGGVYLGGTGAANKLDDYEEGEWSPGVNVGSVTASNRRYVKIGNQVTVWAFLSNFTDRSSTTDIQITGLPFTSSSASRHTGSIMFRYVNAGSGVIGNTLYLGANSSSMFIYGQYTGAYDPVEFADLNSSSAEIYITLTYQTDA